MVNNLKEGKVSIDSLTSVINSKKHVLIYIMAISFLMVNVIHFIID